MYKSKKEEDCPFCEIQSDIIAKNSLAIAFDDMYPIVIDHILKPDILLYYHKIIPTSSILTISHASRGIQLMDLQNGVCYLCVSWQSYQTLDHQLTFLYVYCSTA